MAEPAKTCKTCRFWGHPIDEYRSGGWERLGTCSSPLFLRGYTISVEEIPDNGALIEDDEGWGIYTGPDFGCIGHEERSTDTTEGNSG
jgi:hypothetical protein